MIFTSIFAIGTLGMAFLQSPTEPGIKSQTETGNKEKTDSLNRSHGCIAFLEWVSYTPERSGSTFGWPRSWKRRAPLSAFFNECVSGPNLPSNGPCHGGFCNQPSPSTASK